MVRLRVHGFYAAQSCLRRRAQGRPRLPGADLVPVAVVAVAEMALLSPALVSAQAGALRGAAAAVTGVVARVPRLQHLRHHPNRQSISD